MTTPEPGGTPGTPVTGLDEAWSAFGRGLDQNGPLIDWATFGRLLIEHRPRIEAEAARSERERLREALGVMQGRFVPAKGYPGDHHGVYWIDIDAVLALLRDE